MIAFILSNENNKFLDPESQAKAGVPGGHAPQKFLAYQVILCFDRWYPKQNTVISQLSSHKIMKKSGFKFFSNLLVFTAN